jgi:NIPSNAP
MEWQLRIYTINEGELAQWIEEWRTHVAPLRRRLGFRVLGPWVDDNTFVWLLGYDGEDGFAAADERYYASPERTSLSPDPARHIAHADQRPLRDLGPIE